MYRSPSGRSGRLFALVALTFALVALTFSPPLEEIRGLWNVATGRDCRFCCSAPSPRSNTSIAVAIGPSGGGDAAGTRTDLDSTLIFCSVTGGHPGGVSESPTLMAARYQYSSQIAAVVSGWDTMGAKDANARKQICRFHIPKPIVPHLRRTGTKNVSSRDCEVVVGTSDQRSRGRSTALTQHKWWWLLRTCRARSSLRWWGILNGSVAIGKRKMWQTSGMYLCDRLRGTFANLCAATFRVFLGQQYQFCKECFKIPLCLTYICPRRPRIDEHVSSQFHRLGSRADAR